MLAVISPAKSLDFKTPSKSTNFTTPELLSESEKLVGRLKKMSPKQLSKLMGISPALGELNFQRYQDWHLPFNTDNSNQAILAFNGDVYQGIDAASLTLEQLNEVQDKLRILSGLYGVLKPLDIIQPYRLEMGTKLKYYRSKDLYSFWKTTITKKMNEALEETESNILINLASNEYFKSINTKKIEAEIVTPEFKDLKNGSYKMISFFAKKARGLMVRFILENNITDPTNLLAFNSEGYNYNSRLSTPLKPVFTRDN